MVRGRPTGLLESVGGHRLVVLQRWYGGGLPLGPSDPSLPSDTTV